MVILTSDLQLNIPCASLLEVCSMLFRCKQSHNSTKGKRQQVTEARKNVKPETPSLFLPYCSSPPSFSIQKAHERKKKKTTLAFFIITQTEVYHK